ncbi:MAG: peptide chain release factor N(5)-glutamine methyltransferase [Cyclobacteriaceae bacterium]|nr:peptide chain release factor N(5)-glutamine methyltransferase [Cyclobacteriaceae bacterium]MCH8516531.1 peptide chain release factor N(5)-glutamine methyltransferase [Cyclobacteriaceae bacterium]
MYSKAFLEIQNQLQPVWGEHEARAITRVLFEELAGFNFSQVVMGVEPTPEQLKQMLTVLPQLLQSKPIQYVLGYTTFADLKMMVNEHTLIPRPETEELVYIILKQHKFQKELTFIDLCSGSGCIAVALSYYLKQSKAYGLELSKEALDKARANAALHAQKIDFIQGDVLNDMAIDLKLDFVVSNPPYVKNSEKRLMNTNVTAYEPHLALFVEDEDPLIFYKQIINNYYTLLKEGGRFYFEINEAHASDLMIFSEEFDFKEREVIKDIRSRDRFIIFKK